MNGWLRSFRSTVCMMCGRVAVGDGRAACEQAAEARFGIGESRTREFGREHRQCAALVRHCVLASVLRLLHRVARRRRLERGPIWARTFRSDFPGFWEGIALPAFPGGASRSAECGCTQRSPRVFDMALSIRLLNQDDAWIAWGRHSSAPGVHRRGRNGEARLSSYSIS